MLLLLVIIGLLAAIATPNFVGGGPSKISGIMGILINIDRTKEEWAVEHGYTNNSCLYGKSPHKNLRPIFTTRMARILLPASVLSLIKMETFSILKA